MKNGFTLVEMLAVIIIIGFLGVTIGPRVLSTINNSKQKAYDKQVATIKDKTKMYTSEFGDTLVFVGGTATITLNSLVTAGYMQEPVKNPITSRDICLTSPIRIVESGNSHTINMTLTDC